MLEQAFSLPKVNNLEPQPPTEWVWDKVHKNQYINWSQPHSPLYPGTMLFVSCQCMAYLCEEGGPSLSPRVKD